MNRREFVKSTAMTAALAAAARLRAQQTADVTLEIAPLKLEIAPGKTISTLAYNGRVPGPLIRWPEGKAITMDVHNRTDIPEIVHWHGLWIPADQDGAMEEGSPMIAPGGERRYHFTPEPAGTRWYHTHTFAGHDLKRALYSGQFGCFYVEPKQEPGDYDQEVFLTLHDWNAYMGNGGDTSMDASYDYATINDRMLGHGEPIRVKQGQRVLFRIVNASATVTHWLGMAGHRMMVLSLDGNVVPVQKNIEALRLAPAERADVLIEMTRPGVWVLGETRDEVRRSGMGVVVEYAGASGEPQWIAPPEAVWDYAQFAHPQAEAAVPDHVLPLVFTSKFHGHGEFDSWMINGKSYPKTDTIMLEQGKRYRLQMVNKSMDDHPVHLHRHTFEVTSLDGRPMSGLRKDVVVVPGKSTAEIDFVAQNPGATLFHCHQQTHMDFGFMMLLRYS
ncbi:multicopper oxidase family protein [Silvibacterium dinghuense]|uniref:Multicopper oxidase family protein n=1 Tax=Silvibacterium dinghuense TaxID=1560006 RepID=A0A4Q1SGH1_9BACT|nr:multicopper oxidase family protein [Silvibacterium dinghuense]RXS96604.1 multicopper oxidase family protein [Silvibacterium dinghuense]GGG92170.1 metallo-oxidoreductase [Silvibacterium dinghuense]